MRGVRYVYRICKPSTANDELENVLVEDGNDGPGGPGGARGVLNDKPVPSKELLQVLIAMCYGISSFSILKSQISRFLSILLVSV